MTTRTQTTEQKTAADEPLNPNPLGLDQDFPASWFLRLAYRLCEFIAQFAPTGYQDDAGFHYGVEPAQWEW
jgi:hypothetical protein